MCTVVRAAHGVFVGLTKRHFGPKDPARASRGTLVVGALALGSARAIHDAMAKVPASRHSGFHLVQADTRDVFATASNGTHLAQLTLGRGIHVLAERSFGAGDDAPRRARIGAAGTRLVPTSTAESPEAELDLARLAQLLTEHDDTDLLVATCIHVPGIRYGTRGGAVLAIAADHRRGSQPAARMPWAEGPPCTTPFAPVDLAPLHVPGPVKTG